MSYCRGEDNQWSCRKAGMVNLQKVGSIVRDIGDPCLHQSPIQVTRMLKADKWQAAFDSDGRVFGFHKALKLIILGGVDQSVRPEVWEFLLGCYALSSTAEYRKQLRSARRERYEVLVKQCQRMHSSIGTGSLAYVVGSKIMDMRKLSKEGRRQTETENKQASDVDTNKLNSYSIQPNISREISYIHQRESSSDSADLVSVRESIDSAAYDISSRVPFSCPCNCSSQEQGREVYDSHNEIENYFDFPQLPVTNLFGNSEECGFHEGSIGTSIPVNSEIEVVHSEVNKPAFRYNSAGYNTDIFNRSTISQAQETTDVNATTTRQGVACDDKVAAWLWTLHRIVVDVVRTDSHLEFYENTRNLARMSDILAVYAWVDPATGYCQGMSDLLSPFVVLFEDDADAFWCFEMLIRRMHENFLIEGPTGVMKQLQTLWYILELTDREMFSHLSNIGAESLHFAFRMLLVLFRRELSFDEALCMWEMIWAADFDESVAYNFESCLEPLMVHLPRDLYPENGDESGDGNGSSHYKHGNGEHVERSLSVDTGLKSAPAQAFCGLARSFWSRNDHMHICNVISSGRYGDDELPVFCVAAILVINRHKIIKRTHSLDDLIKIFNDKILKINVKRCVRTAIKLRRKYFYKLIRKSSAARNSE